MLRHERVKERLTGLLDRVAERGVRATFREALAFVSFLIFAGKSCTELRAAGSSRTRTILLECFRGTGFDLEQLGVGLDPVRQTDARVDEHLWRGGTTRRTLPGMSYPRWSPATSTRSGGIHPTQAEEGFVALKRRWYLEHRTGRLVHTSQADKTLPRASGPRPQHATPGGPSNRSHQRALEQVRPGAAAVFGSGLRLSLLAPCERACDGFGARG